MWIGYQNDSNCLTIYLIIAIMEQFILQSSYLIDCVFMIVLDYSVDNMLKDSIS